MQRSRIPSTVRWKIEFLAGRACHDCGRAIDAARLRQHLESALQAIADRGLVLKSAAFEFELGQRCHECHARQHGDRFGGAVRAFPLPELAERRHAELRDYFEHSPARIADNPRLRAPQREAYRAARQYFSGESEAATAYRKGALPAIVEIPTGCGKTGIMCTAPFGISRGRVLIITPNLTIKRNLVKSMEPLDAGYRPSADNFYLKCGVFDDPAQLPRFVVLERGQANLEDCLRADIVVANIQQMPGWLPHFGAGFFDMIIVDEAHHEPAESWQRVNEMFPDAKKLYLTATPFRADNKLIVGETIYRYRLGQAIAHGYVKNIMRIDAVASKMTFTVEGEEREFALEDILAMREEVWFSKGVALSEVCNATIVERSIALWQEKRQNGIAHQMIGAACSIRHAVQIVELYNARGVRATHVASEGMVYEERTARIAAYEAGRYDCIVHVGILGEGYDHPNISVAAIFRPYRSLSPYAQFIGRAIRWIRGAPKVDNLAHVVSHVGLNLNHLWEYFKHESREAAILSYLDQLFFNDGPRGPLEEVPEFDLEIEQELGAQVTDETIEGFDIDTFLPLDGLDLGGLGVAGHTLRRFDIAHATLHGQGFRAVGVAGEQTQRERTLRERTGGASPATKTRSKHRFKEETLPLPFNRPDMERKQYRLWLSKEVQRAAGYILSLLRLPVGVSLPDFLGHDESEERHPYAAMVSALHRTINQALGKDETSSNRNDWTLDELLQARQLVAEARDDTLRRLKRQIQEREQFTLPF